MAMSDIDNTIVQIIRVVFVVFLNLARFEVIARFDLIY